MWVFKKEEVFFLFILLLINIFFIFFFYNKILDNTENYFTYPLDDTYIHLAMAKNFLNHKTMGINGEFASTTSSPLFTLIISLLFLISGERIDLPLILNIFISFTILIYLFFILKKYFKPFHSFLLVLLFYFLIPVPVLLFSGLEHLLHILFILILVNLFLSFLYSDKKNGFLLFLFSILSTSTRYESIFLIFPLILLLLFRKKIKEAFLIFSGCLLPIIIYGFYSISKGWYFLPNSLILKGFLFNFGSIQKIFLSFGSKLYNEILMNIYFVPILLLCLFILYGLENSKDFFKSRINSLSFVLFINILSHLYFAKTGWLYRYEAYLIALSIVLFSNYLLERKIKTSNSIISKISLYLLIFLFFIPFLIRSYNAFSDLPVASKNIYQQQIQMAKFLQSYYKNDWVGVNDIGAVCYFKEKVLDIWGLGDIEITKKMVKHLYDKNFLKQKIEQKGVKVLVIYEKTFEFLRGIPKGLILAGKWQIENNKVCGYDTISFYSKEEEFQNLLRNLKEYSFVLPKEVKQSGLYLQE